jgi:hypothetical protein
VQITAETGRAIRITLVSLWVAAQRVRFLAERGEIEVDDLPPPAIPPRFLGRPYELRSRLSEVASKAPSDAWPDALW